MNLKELRHEANFRLSRLLAVLLLPLIVLVYVLISTAMGFLLGGASAFRVSAREARTACRDVPMFLALAFGRKPAP